ncbi:cytochrome P450 [Streptomyces sp. NBS 14/10]|uniref:cytochrome P450 n=1 Tax=Streptomyces sp. NBS 14/10 TaxID=1945643 RepID=UPI000B7CDFC8|nr:cytochrome P450 [Streptomyces sp. NBS 14/10]KAK1182391.1 cytochrome P450 [Streptomyces sp. NBS 14/10]
MTAPTRSSKELSKYSAIPSLSLRENLSGILAARRDQLSFVSHAATRGDIVRLRLGGLPMVLINHPDHFQHVLVDAHANYDKDNFLYRAVQTVFRGGLVSNPGGERWRTRRRMMQPSFNRGSIVDLTPGMTELTGELLDRWAGRDDPDAVVDISADIRDLALKIALRSLFGVEASAEVALFERNFLELNTIIGNFFRFPFPPLNRRPRLRALIRDMDGFVDRLVADREADPAERRDLFAALLTMTHPTSGVNLTRQELLGEILSTIVSGYETSSNSMAWVCYRLARHPEVQRRVQEEVDQVLDGRVPTLEDLSELTYTRMVMDETLRLHTPAWQTMRRAIHEDEIGGYRIPEGCGVYLNFLTYHRHPEFWPDPDRFDPERFAPENTAKRPRNVYQPFGSGPRYCIGKYFALTEMQIVIAMLAQNFTVTVPPGQPPVGFAPLVTLHPKGGIQLRLARR